MGRKGVDKRKRNQSKAVSRSNAGGNAASRYTYPAESMPVASVVRGKGSPIGNGGANPPAGSSRSQKDH
jgi:hypothetical protein